MVYSVCLGLLLALSLLSYNVDAKKHYMHVLERNNLELNEQPFAQRGMKIAAKRNLSSKLGDYVWPPSIDLLANVDIPLALWSFPVENPNAAKPLFVGFPFDGVMVRVSEIGITFINVTTGAVFGNLTTECPSPDIVVNAGGHIGYYGCSKNSTIIVFNALTAQQVVILKLEEEFNIPVAPKDDTDDRGISEYVPFYQNDVLLLTVQYSPPGQKVAQGIVGVNLKTPSNPQIYSTITFDKNCDEIMFQNIQRNSEESNTLSAFVACSNGLLFSVADITNPSYTKASLATSYYRITPVLTTLPNTTYGRFSTVYVAYSASSDPSADITVEQRSTLDGSVVTGSTVTLSRKQNPSCGDPTAIGGFVGRSVIVNEVFFFMSPCTLYSVAVPNSVALYSVDVGLLGTFRDMYFSGTIDYIITASTEQNLMILDVASGILRKSSHFATMGLNIAVRPFLMYNALHNPGHITPTYSNFRVGVAVLTGSNLYVIDLSNFNSDVRVASNIKPGLAPMWFPLHSVLVMVGEDSYTMAVSTQFGRQFNIESKVATQDGAVLATLYDQDVGGLYVFAVDMAGHAMWRSKDVFTTLSDPVPVMNRYVLVARRTTLAILDGMSGETVQMIDMTTGCIADQPLSRFTFLLNTDNFVSSADGKRVYFTMGTYCVYVLEETLQLTAFNAPLMTVGPPILDEANHKIILYNGASYVTIDTISGKSGEAQALGEEIISATPLSTVTVPSTAPETVVIVTTAHAVYAQDHLRPSSSTIWSYFFPASSIIESRPLFFNNHLYLKVDTSMVKLSLDPTIPPEKRVVWNASCPDNMNTKPAPGKVPLVATTAGAIVLQFQNELFFYSEADGSVLLQKRWYCEDGTNANNLKFFPQQYFIAAICQHSAHLLDGLTGDQSLVAYVLNAMDVVLYEDAVIMVGGRSFSTAVLPPYLAQRTVPNTTVAPAPAIPTLPADATLPPHQTAAPAHFDGSRVAPFATRTTPYVNKYVTTDTNKVASWGLAFAIDGKDHKLYAVDVTTTLPVWSSELNTSLCSASAVMAFGAAVEQGSVLLSCASSKAPFLVGVNATTGEQLWENRDIIPPHMIAGFDDTTDAIVANDATVARINALTGAIVWTAGTNPLSTLMVINQVADQNDNATVLVVDKGNNFTAISFATGAATATVVESTCSVLAVIEVQNQLNQGYHINGLAEVFYQCDDDIRIFDLVTGNKEVVIKDIGEVPLFVSLTPDLGQLMISLPKSFKLWDVKTKVFLYTYDAPTKSMFMGISAATEYNIIVLMLDTDNVNGDVQFAALPKTGDGNTVQPLWFVDSGPNVGHISGNRLAGVVPISGNVTALLCGISYILDVSSGFMMAQMIIDAETAHVYKETNRSFIEGTTVVNKALKAIALVADAAMISISVQPGNEKFGFMYYNALSTVDSIVVNGTHYTVLGDSLGTIALAEDNGNLKWQTLGSGHDAMAPLNVLGVGAVTGSDGVGYLGVFHTNGVNLLNVLTGELIEEMVGLRSSVGLNGFTKRDTFLPYGDSFYVAAREFLLRYDPATRKMSYAEVSNIVEPIQRIGCFSSDQSVVTVVTNRGSILGVNTTTMTVLWLSLESRLDAQLRGTVTPSAAFRKIAPRGSAPADKEIFIAYNAAINKFDYISYATGEVQMRLSLGSHTIESYSVSRDGMLYIANGLGIAKFTNELTNDTSGVGHVWARRLPEYESEGIPYVPKIVEVPNMGVVVVAYSCKYLVTLRASDGALLTKWEGNNSFNTLDCEVFAPSQGIDDPLTADVLLLYNDVNPSAPIVHYRRATLGDEENYAAVDGVSLETSLFQDDLYVYYFVQHNGIGLLPILIDTSPGNTTGLTPTPFYDVRIPDGFQPLDFKPKPQPFTPKTTSVRRAARIWSSPTYDEELSIGFKTEHYFAATIDGASIAISMTSMWETGMAFVNYTYALNGSVAHEPYPITFTTEELMWLGRLNSKYGAYFTNNVLVGFSLNTMEMTEAFNHSGLTSAPLPIGDKYPDGTLVAPIMTTDGAVTCLVMRDKTIVCIQLADGNDFGHVVVIPVGFTIQTAPQLYEDKYIAVATKDGEDGGWALSAFNIRTGESLPASSALPSDSDKVQQTARYAVAYKSNSATAYHYNGTPTGWPTTSFPIATSLYALYEGAAGLYAVAGMLNIECGMIAAANLVTAELLWNVSITYSDVDRPRPATNDEDCKPLNIIIINDPRSNRTGKQLVVVQHKVGYLFGFDLSDGSLQFRHRSYPATAADFLKPVTNGFILFSTAFSSAEMTNLVKPEESWFGEWSDRWLGEHLELFTDSASGMTGALRSIDGRLTGSVIPIEGGVMYSSHYVQGSAQGRYVVFRGTDDSAGIVDTVDPSKSWAVYLVNQTYTPEVDNSFTFIDDEMNTFFFVGKHTVTGLSAKDGSLLFRLSLPECGGTITRVTATAFDSKAGMLYLGFDQCVLRVDKEGKFLKTTIKEFIGNSIMLSTKCILVVSTFGNVMCVPREKFDNKVETLWSVAAGISSSQMKILEYRPGYLVIVRGNRQILVEEATGKPVFYKASPGANPMAVIVDKYLVELTSDIFSVTDLTPELPMSSRTVAWYSTEFLNPDAAPGYHYLRPVAPLILPWGVVVLQVEGRLIGYDLQARQFVFNETIGLFNPEEGTLMYIPGNAKSPNAGIQNSVIAYNGNVFDARTGKPLALYEMVSGSIDGLLLPNGVTVSQDDSFMYVSSLPFHYIESQASVTPTSTPAPMPTGATPGTMPPNWTPEGEYPPVSTLPPDVTVPNIGCAMEVRSQVALFSSCMYEIILTQQNAGTLEQAKCNDLTPLVTRCIDKWEKTAHCEGSILFLAEVLTSLKTKSAGFPYCTNASTCVDDGSTKLCAAIDAGIAMAGGKTLYPGFHFPEPADEPPVFDPVPPATEPPAGEEYFQFISTGPAGTSGVPLLLDTKVRDLLSLTYKPTLEIVMMTDNDFVWRFYDPSVALAHSRVVAELLYQNYQRTIRNLGLLACVAVTYTPDKNGTTTTTTTPGPTEPTSQTPGPTPGPTQPTKAYSFLVTVKSQQHLGLADVPPNPVPRAFPRKVASEVNAPSPANLSYISLLPEQHQFVFVWADSAEEQLYSPRLANLIQLDANRTANDLGVAAIVAQEVTSAPVPTTIPNTTSDNGDDGDTGRTGLSGGAVAGIVILVLVVIVVVGGLLYRFVLRKRLRRYYSSAESAYILEDRTLQEKV